MLVRLLMIWMRFFLTPLLDWKDSGSDTKQILPVLFIAWITPRFKNKHDRKERTIYSYYKLPYQSTKDFTLEYLWNFHNTTQNTRLSRRVFMENNINISPWRLWRQWILGTKSYRDLSEFRYASGKPVTDFNT